MAAEVPPPEELRSMGLKALRALCKKMGVSETEEEELEKRGEKKYFMEWIERHRPAPAVVIPPSSELAEMRLDDLETLCTELGLSAEEEGEVEGKKACIEWIEQRRPAPAPSFTVPPAEELEGMRRKELRYRPGMEPDSSRSPPSAAAQPAMSTGDGCPSQLSPQPQREAFETKSASSSVDSAALEKVAPTPANRWMEVQTAQGMRWMNRDTRTFVDEEPAEVRLARENKAMKRKAFVPIKFTELTHSPSPTAGQPPRESAVAESSYRYDDEQGCFFFGPSDAAEAETRTNKDVLRHQVLAPSISEAVNPSFTVPPPDELEGMKRKELEKLCTQMGMSEVEAEAVEGKAACIAWITQRRPAPAPGFTVPPLEELEGMKRKELEKLCTQMGMSEEEAEAVEGKKACIAWIVKHGPAPTVLSK